MQVIGLMIALYILTRMLDLLSTDTNLVAKASASITIVAASICIGMLLIAGDLVDTPLP